MAGKQNKNPFRNAWRVPSLEINYPIWSTQDPKATNACSTWKCISTSSSCQTAQTCS